MKLKLFYGPQKAANIVFCTLWKNVSQQQLSLLQLGKLIVWREREDPSADMREQNVILTEAVY